MSWNANYILAQKPTEEVWKPRMGSDNSSTIRHHEGFCAFQILLLLGPVGLCHV